MPGALPLVEDSPGSPPSLWSVSGEASALGAAVGGGVGMNTPGDAGNNTHLWVAGVMVFALAGIFFLHVTGFRFATDIGITRG